jgi:hypothetical protein
MKLSSACLLHDQITHCGKSVLLLVDHDSRKVELQNDIETSKVSQGTNSGQGCGSRLSPCLRAVRFVQVQLLFVLIGELLKQSA